MIVDKFISFGDESVDSHLIVMLSASVKLWCDENQLTQCKGDVVTHAQQLTETHWASISLYPQLLHSDEHVHNIYIY